MLGKSAMRYGKDFQTLLQLRKFKKSGGMKFHNKRLLMVAGICCVFGIFIFGRHCRDEHDKRVRLGYGPLLLTIVTLFQWYTLDKFYDEDTSLDGKKVHEKKSD